MLVSLRLGRIREQLTVEISRFLSPGNEALQIRFIDRADRVYVGTGAICLAN